MLGIKDSNQKIITDGLVFHLDAAQLKSYPRTGTTWTDLTSGNMDGTLYNSATYNSGNGGYILFNSLTGTSQYYRTTTTNTKVNIKTGAGTAGSVAGVTLSAWIYCPLRDFDQYPIIQATDSSGNYDYSITGNGTRINLQMYGGNVFLLSETNIPDATWCHVAVTVPSVAVGNTSVTARFYKNGVQQSTGTIASNAFNFPTNTVQIGRSGTRYGYLRVAAAYIYTRELSATEVLQNFNANRIRFGL